MDYLRQLDWFDPERTQASVTVVGCGGIGSFAALALAKLGVQRIQLVDYDDIEEHNIPNQFYGPWQVGANKTDALADLVNDFTGTMPYCMTQPLVNGIPLNDIVVSALDNMESRAELWQQVKYKTKCQLFLDGRLGGENVVLYAVNPTSPDDVAGYEATLHSDAEGLDLPCTGRSIIDVGFAVGSLITRAVRKHYAREELPKVTFLDQKNLDIYKGGWAA